VSDRLLKNAILARSGIYQYAKSELAALGLGDPPPWVGDKDVYNVYRPATILAQAVKDGKFNRLPLTLLHPPEFLDQDNFKEYIAGWTGDVAEVQWVKDVQELAVRSTLTIGDAEAADAYASGVKELSHGYVADFEWRSGEVDGQHFDAVMTAIRDGNHMALVPAGRAGKLAAILDHKGADVKVKTFVSGLFRLAHSRKKGATDKAPETFEQALDKLIADRAKLTEDEIGSRVEGLKALVADLPTGGKRELLDRYLADMKLIKGEDDETAKQVKDIVCDLVKQIDVEIARAQDEELQKKIGGGDPPDGGEPKPPNALSENKDATKD
jgi:hypothetical protein